MTGRRFSRRMHGNVWLALWLMTSLTFGACAGGPAGAQSTPEDQLELARTALAAKNYQEALNLFLAIDPDDLPRIRRSQWMYGKGLARYQTGDYWNAYRDVRPFADDHPLSEDRPRVAELIYRIGRDLSQSDHYVPIFADDRNDARVILEHLVTFYPNANDRDDGLTILGNLAFDRRIWELAESRYQEVVRDYPESEWFGWCRVRLAMTSVRRLRGPTYDLAALEVALQELDLLIGNPPELPKEIEEAKRERDKIVNWIAEHHLSIANYYQTLSQPVGERQHLEFASAAPYGETSFGKEAARRLAALSKEPNQPSPATDPDKESTKEKNQ